MLPSTGIYRKSGVSDHAAAGFEAYQRPFDLQLFTFCLNAGRDFADIVGNIDMGLRGKVTHSVTAAQVKLFGEKAGFGIYIGDESQHDICRAKEHIRIEHLRTYMAVEAGKDYIRQ